MLMRQIGRLLLVTLTGVAVAIIGVLVYQQPTTTANNLNILANLIINKNPKSNSHSHSQSQPTVIMSTTKPVIVVGSGLAGLTAAHQALKSGAPKVRMLDRAPKPGGNSIKASSGINGAPTRFQKAAGIQEVGSTSFHEDTVRSAGRRFRDGKGGVVVDREALISTLTGGSRDAVEWLVDEIGVELSVVAQLGGHSSARTHRGAGKTPPGFAIVSALLKKLEEHAEFQLTSSAEVVSLSTSADGKTVDGVRYVTADGGEPQHLEGAVVFAAGGFGGDATGLLAKHRPDLAGMPSTNDARPGAHGILEAVGAAFVDMDSVQVHPTGFIDPKDAEAPYKILAAEALRGEGGILLSGEGKRFVNEMETREHVSDAIMNLPKLPVGEKGTRQWDVSILLDAAACEAMGGHLGFYMFKGLMEKKKVKDLSPAVIAAVDEYASAVASGTDAAFGRKTFGRWKMAAGPENRDLEVCVGRVTPVVHFTMGGAALSDKARVLRGDGTAIEGVWAAGEITGGVHGDNRLGGSSLLECVVFGRIAGTEAAKAVTGS